MKIGRLEFCAILIYIQVIVAAHFMLWGDSQDQYWYKVSMTLASIVIITTPVIIFRDKIKGAE